MTGDKYTEINRPLITGEYEAAVQFAGDLGLRLDVTPAGQEVMRVTLGMCAVSVTQLKPRLAQTRSLGSRHNWGC